MQRLEKRRSKMKRWNCEEYAEQLAFTDLFFGSGFQGITHAYGINEDGISHALYSYWLTPNITVGAKNDRRETRAYREMLRRDGKKVPKIHEDALRDELYVVPRAAMTPADVVKALRKLTKHIEKNGMVIGKYEDTYIKERISGEPRFEESDDN
jgi:hypothetical protein